MSKKENEPNAQEELDLEETPGTEAPETAEAPESEAPETQEQVPSELDTWKAKVHEQEDKFLRLCAEYDNFRKRSQKEKEGIYADATAKAVSAQIGRAHV